jgi:iron complex outermembrane receptor protein
VEHCGFAGVADTHEAVHLVRFDPGVGEAYDTEGYVDYFSVRGFVIDNRFNFRRDGLPINAETSIPLENKARVDVLKGLSGLQAGTSAPGGLVDLAVKRPLDAPLRSAFVEWR